MHYATLKAEFITPCFCGGADQRKPELRTQSIRGQLRWWYRICGATQDEEAELFGSTKKASPLIMRIDNISISQKPEKFNWKDKENEVLSKYLWYFLKNQKRKSLPVKTSFDLVLKSREKDLLKKGVAVAALWISLGALGSRSTRAAGCMRLVTGYVKDTSFLWEKVSTQLSLAKGKKAPFELYKSDSAMKDGLEAAEWLAKKWRELRSHETPSGIGKKDHDEASNLLKGKKSEEIKVRRVVLGMPYTQDSRKSYSPFKNNKLQWNPAKGEDFHGTSRLSSPVHLRPIYKNGEVYPALLIFTDRLSHCPNHVYAPKAGKIQVDKIAAINKLKSICTIQEI
jgi:CRISPR-associated protein Cmr1